MKDFIASARHSGSTARRAATGTAILGALLAAPAAFAGMPVAAPALATATPAPAVAPPPVFAALSPGETLSNHALARIRGGWDISPRVTVDFAYHAITTINGTVVASVMIPHVQFSLGSNGPVIQNTPSITTTSTPPTTPVSTPVTTPIITTPVRTTPGGTTPATTTPATTTPAATTHVANAPATGGADPTQSTFNINQMGSQFSSAVTTVSTSGINTLVKNTMNNTIIQNTGWANIGINGLPAMMTQQAGATMLNQNLVAAGHAFR